FTSNVTLTGSDDGNGSLIRGFNLDNTIWRITGNNAGRVSGTAGKGVVTFEGFANLQGGSGSDTFYLEDNIRRQIFGGSGNDFFYISTDTDGEIRGQDGDDRF